MSTANYDRVLEYFKRNKVVTAPAIQFNLGIGFADTVEILHSLEKDGRIDYIGGIHYVYRKNAEVEKKRRISEAECLRRLRSEADERRFDLLRRAAKNRDINFGTPDSSFLPFDDPSDTPLPSAEELLTRLNPYNDIPSSADDIVDINFDGGKPLSEESLAEADRRALEISRKVRFEVCARAMRRSVPLGPDGIPVTLDDFDPHVFDCPDDPDGDTSPEEPKDDPKDGDGE